MSFFSCEVCEFAKHKRVSFPQSNKRCSTPFSLVHSDVWGPSNVTNNSGARWFISLIDDYSRMCWIYLLKNKSYVSSVIPVFHTMIQNQFGVKIKRFRSDNAKDYFNSTLHSYFQKEKIIHESSCVHTPQQNGLSEKKNGHLLNITRVFLFQQHLPKSYWGDAVLTASHLINRLSSRVLGDKSPLDMLSESFPNLHTNQVPPKVFGCVCFVHVHSPSRGKLDPRALKCVFVGFFVLSSTI